VLCSNFDVIKKLRGLPNFEWTAFSNFWIWKRGSLEIGRALRCCAEASLALIALDDRKVQLDVQTCKKRGTLRPLPLNCALTFIHVSKLFSFWNWKEIE